MCKHITFRVTLFLLVIGSVRAIFLMFFCASLLFAYSNKNLKRSRLLLMSFYSTTLLGGSLPTKETTVWEEAHVRTEGVHSTSGEGSWQREKDSFLLIPREGWASQCQQRVSEWAGLASQAAGLRNFRYLTARSLFLPLARGNSLISAPSLLPHFIMEVIIPQRYALINYS